MARPNRPRWFPPRQCFRSQVRGTMRYFPRSIGRHDQPQIDGIPRAAWDYLHALQRQAEGRATAGGDLTVYLLSEMYTKWCEGEVEGDRLSAGQYKGHCTHLTKFCEHPWRGGTVADLHAGELTVEVVEDFFEEMRRRGVEVVKGGEVVATRPASTHYVANLGKSIRAMLRWSARPIKGRNPPRLIPEDPLRDYRFPRAPGSVRGYVEGATVRRFLRWAWARARRREGLMRRFDRLYVMMLRFQRLTGCRPGEACRLRWDQIDWDSGAAVLVEHKTDHLTTRARRIFLTPPVVRLLRAVERLPGRHAEYVFTHRRVNGAIDRGQSSAVAGEPWVSGSTASQKVTEWRELAVAAGLEGIEKVGPRRLVAYANRHGYASEAVSRFGMSHEQAAELLGNTAAVVARVYAHSIHDAAAERAREFAERRRGRPKAR